MQESIKGLSERQVLLSREKHGENRLPTKKPKGLLKTVWENLCDPIIRILLAALLANVLFTYKHINWAECGGILLSVFIATLVSALSERGGERAFAKMNEMSKQRVSVIRDGTQTAIDPTELVVGDTVCLFAGQRVPADGKVISGEMKVDQSALNGESAAVKKYPQKEGDGSPDDHGMLLSGSLVLWGDGYMLVTKVGEDTLYGKIALELQEENTQSPMKERLTRLARTISRIGYFAAALVSLTYLVNAFFLSDGSFFLKIRDGCFVGTTLVRAITTAITVIVVAVPEGLPMMLTVVLCANMKKMYNNGVMVKKPVGIETAGSMNILFCDKTGTLTTGNLSVDAFYLADLTKITTPMGLRREKHIYPYLLLQAGCNTGATLEKGKAVGGNATERALLSFVGKTAACKIKSKLPFDSRYKFSSVTLGDLSMPMTLYKGAPEVLLPKCNTCLSCDGTVLPLTDKGAILRKIAEIAKNLGRTILLCHGESPPNGEIPPEGLTLIGILSLRDEIRPTAQRSLSQMEKAGVQTVMLTGDSRETAASIAKRLGFSLSGEYAVMTSAELSALSDGEVKTILPSLRVLARALPSDKSRLVRLSREMGLVVGMTGDGVNDAPALKAADVGFAMGSGTEVAKAASDIVITDCDFRSIVKAVLFGRTVFKSLRKFIVFQLTMNLCAVGVSLFGQLVGIETPITVVQMLWVNIIMDTLGGLAFAGEAPMERYLSEKPKKRDEPILTREMVKKTLTMGGYTVLLCTVFLFSPRVRAMMETREKLLCAFFALFIFCGIAIQFVSRSEGRSLFAGITKNPGFLVIMLSVLAVQMIMLYFGGAVLRCVPLAPRQLIYPLLLSLTVFPVDLLRRLFVFLRKK